MKHVTVYTPSSPLTQQLWEIKKKAATRKGPPDSSGKPTRETSKGGKPGTIERGSSYEGSQRFVHVTGPDGVMHKVLAKDAKAVASGRSSGKPHFRTTTVKEDVGDLTSFAAHAQKQHKAPKKAVRPSKIKSVGGKISNSMRDAKTHLGAKAQMGVDSVKAKISGAKKGAKALGGKISSTIRSGADSVKRFGKGTMHGMKKGMQGTKGYKKGTAQKRGQWTGNKLRQGYDSVKRFGKGTMHGMKKGMQGTKGYTKGTAQKRGQWTGNKLRQGYRGAKKLGGKGIEGIKKHGPTVARGLKKGALASLHHGVKATRQIGGAVKSGWEAGGPKPKLQAPKAGAPAPKAGAPAQAGAPAPAARRPLKAAPAQGGGSRGQGGGSRGQGGGGGNQTINFNPQIQQNQGGGGGGQQQQQQGRGAKGGRRVGDNAKGEKEKPLTGKEQGQWDRDREIAKGGGLIKRRIRQISGGTSRVAQGVMNAAKTTGGNA